MTFLTLPCIYNGVHLNIVMPSYDNNSCPFRSLRYASTIVGMEIATSLTKVLASLKQNLTTKQQQAEAEKKKRNSRRDSTAADEAEEIHQKIVDIENEISAKIFTG